MYIEGRGKKILAKSTVKRAVDKLVKKGLLTAEETSFGTLFTIVNAEDLSVWTEWMIFLSSDSRNEL